MSERVVTPGFHDRVFEVVRTVPEGFVTTYGDVATHLGSPRVARHVGWALAALGDDTDVPWHRVINAQGRISHRGDVVRAEVQIRRLAIEGISFDETGRCDLTAHRWRYGGADGSMDGISDERASQAGDRVVVGTE